ncbi:MAG: ATP-binding protein [Aestuariibacter sp.]
MESLKNRLTKFSQSLGKKLDSGPATDYDTLRRTYELQANDDIKHLQNQAKIDRIASIHGRSDLNPKWVFDNIQMDSPDVVEAVSIAKSFIAAHQDPSWRQSGSHMMLFYGDYGRGKSHIAGAIAHELINQHEISVLYRQLSSLLEMRFFSYDYSAQDNIAEKFREINQELMDVDLLILDEVCVNESQLKKNAQSWLGNLLRQRLVNKKNCILITNHDLAHLYKAVGSYCFESIKEYDTYKVQFSGNSRRAELIDEQPSLQSQPSGYKPNQIK